MRTLTPLWTGGIDGKCDRIHETGILGSLRWWMEVLVRGVGGQVKDPTSDECSGLDPKKFDAKTYRQLQDEAERRQYLRNAGLCDVSQIFGATGWKQRFHLTVIEEKLDWQPSVRLKITPPDRTRGWFLNPGWLGTLHMRLHSDAETLAKLHTLLRFVEAWGSLGARPQLGYGAFRILEIKDAPLPFPYEVYGDQPPSDQPDLRTFTPDLRTFTFFKLRFTPKTTTWWHAVPGIKELRTKRDSWAELEQLANQGMVPTTPALKNYLRYHQQWSSPALPHWLFGTIRPDERLRSKVAFSWAYRLIEADEWEIRGWMYLPQNRDSRVWQREIWDKFKENLGQPQTWLSALGLQATDYRAARVIISPPELPWKVHKISEMQTFLAPAKAGEQMINRITIKGFRGIQFGSMGRFGQFNVFVGANNAGKSAVIEALYLATANQEVGLIRQEESDVFCNSVLISQQDLLGNHPFKVVAGKHSDLGDSLNLSRSGERFLIITIPDRTAALQRFELDFGKVKFSTDSAALFAVDSAPENQDLAKILWEDVESLAEPYRTVFCWYPELTYYAKGSATWAIEGQPPAHTFFCDTSTQSYVPIDFCRRNMNAISGWTDRIAKHFAAILELDPDSFTVQFFPIEDEDRDKMQGWIARKDKPALSIDAFGDGARAAFRLLAPLIVMAELATPEAPGLLLWENPEFFQNPKTLGRLLAEVINIIRDKPIQVFVATHSLEFVAYVTQMLQSNDLRPEETMVFHMALANGQLKSSWFDRDTLITWLDSGIDPRAWKDFVSPFNFTSRGNTHDDACVW